MKVFLADLRHNHRGVLNVDFMPLGIGYMKSVMDRELPDVSSRLFAYPDVLWEAIKDDPPHVLMLSNYCWNETLSLHLAAAAKRRNPDVLVVMGGPNLPVEADRQLAYVRQHPQIDVYILGEGDFLATEVVRHFLNAGADLERFRQSDIPSAIIRRPGSEITMSQVWDRRRSIDEIPSPYLDGIMDEFFDGKLAPMIETNRGCPFKCTFCVQGSDWYTKVAYFDVGRLREEIDRIGWLIKEKSPLMGTLMIADPNYGMYERDAEISGYIGDAQAKYGWPTFINASTGKNRPDRIMRALERVNNALTFRQALQSTNKETLDQIKRSNIKQDAYAEVMAQVQGRGMRSISDLILGLPRETLESHVQSIHQLVDAGTKEMYNFQLMLLKGTELDTNESRERHEFETRWRVIPKGFGVYDGEKVLETEEIVVSNSTMTFDDYVKARKYAFAFSTFWNNSWFDDLVSVAGAFGVKRSACLDAMLRSLEDDEGPAGQSLDGFVAETIGELYPSQEACIRFYTDDEHFASLERGDIGDNLLYKYRAQASFFLWPELCAVAFRAVRGLIETRTGRLDAGFWDEFQRYTELRHAHGHTRDEILGTATAEFLYDFDAWIEAGTPMDVAAFRYERPVSHEFALPQEYRRELAAALNVWGTELKSLTKGVTRIRAVAQVRTCRPVERPMRQDPGAA